MKRLKLWWTNLWFGPVTSGPVTVDMIAAAFDVPPHLLGWQDDDAEPATTRVAVLEEGLRVAHLSRFSAAYVTVVVALDGGDYLSTTIGKN